MNAPTRLGVFAAGLLAVFGAAVGVGSTVGPVGTAAEDDGHAMPAARPSATPEHDPVKGLSMTENGYTLRLATPTLPAGQAAELAFTVHGPDGSPVTAYTPTHDKELHLIVVRRDLGGFHHVHPERDPAGQWSVPITLDRAGAYKVFADFTPADGGHGLTLAADLHVPGDYSPEPLPAVSRTATVDGYTVTLDGDLAAGAESKLTLTVTKDGQPVTDLHPYLGAYGHLVALRAGDLAYLHVHPDGEPGDGRTAPGPQITFFADVPSAGDYRLYLDFQHEGVVRTAEFTATADGDGGPVPTGTATPGPAETPQGHDSRPHGH
jgi:hypothetical protein